MLSQAGGLRVDGSLDDRSPNNDELVIAETVVVVFAVVDRPCRLLRREGRRCGVHAQACDLRFERIGAAADDGDDLIDGQGISSCREATIFEFENRFRRLRRRERRRFESASALRVSADTGRSSGTSDSRSGGPWA